MDTRHDRTALRRGTDLAVARGGGRRPAPGSHARRHLRTHPRDPAPAGAVHLEALPDVSSLLDPDRGRRRRDRHRHRGVDAPPDRPTVRRWRNAVSQCYGRATAKPTARPTPSVSRSSISTAASAKSSGYHPTRGPPISARTARRCLYDGLTDVGNCGACASGDRRLAVVRVGRQVGDFVNMGDVADLEPGKTGQPLWSPDRFKLAFVGTRPKATSTLCRRAGNERAAGSARRSGASRPTRPSMNSQRGRQTVRRSSMTIADETRAAAGPSVIKVCGRWPAGSTAATR